MWTLWCAKVERDKVVCPLLLLRRAKALKAEKRVPHATLSH